MSKHRRSSNNSSDDSRTFSLLSHATDMARILSPVSSNGATPSDSTAKMSRHTMLDSANAASPPPSPASSSVTSSRSGRSLATTSSPRFPRPRARMPSSGVGSLINLLPATPTRSRLLDRSTTSLVPSPSPVQWQEQLGLQTTSIGPFPLSPDADATMIDYGEDLENLSSEVQDTNPWLTMCQMDMLTPQEEDILTTLDSMASRSSIGQSATHDHILELRAAATTSSKSSSTATFHSPSAESGATFGLGQAQAAARQSWQLQSCGPLNRPGGPRPLGAADTPKMLSSPYDRSSSASPPKARQLISLFEEKKHSGASPVHNGGGLPRTDRRRLDIRDCSSLTTTPLVDRPSTMHLAKASPPVTRFIRAADQLGPSFSPAQSRLTEPAEGPASPPGNYAPQGQQSPSREISPTRSMFARRRNSRQEGQSSSILERSSSYRSADLSPARSLIRPAASDGAQPPSALVAPRSATSSLPMSDLVPAVAPGHDIIVPLDTSSPRRKRRSKTASTSYRQSREIGDLPLSTDGAAAMLDLSCKDITAQLQGGRLWYYDVHKPDPEWLRAQAVLFPSALALSWIPEGGGRENVVLELDRCKEVHSLPSVDQPGSADDQGAQRARKQG